MKKKNKPPALPKAVPAKKKAAPEKAVMKARKTMRDEVKDRIKQGSEPQPPPPPPYTDDEIKAAGFDLNAKPVHNANCAQSAQSQVTTNTSFNDDLWDRFTTSNKYHEDSGQGEKPKAPQRCPLREQDAEPDQPYFRNVDARAMEIICKNDAQVFYPAEYDY